MKPGPEAKTPTRFFVQTRTDWTGKIETRTGGDYPDWKKNKTGTQTRPDRIGTSLE